MNKILDKLLYVFYGIVIVAIILGGFYFYNRQYSFNIIEKNISMIIGDKYTVVVYPKNGYFNLDDYSVSLSNDNLSIDGLTLTAVKEGTTEVKIKSKKGLNSKKIKVSVINSTLASLVAPNELTVSIDETKKLDVVINDNKNIKANLKYESSNSDIASVDEYGNVTGIKAGNATIKIMYSDDIFVYTNVTVTEKEIKLKNINVPEKIELEIGETKNIDITYDPEDATHKELVFESSNEKIVKVVNGKAVAVGSGDATITVKSGKIKKKIKVVVNKKEVKKDEPEKYTLHMSVNKNNLYVGDTAQLTCFITSNKGLYEECNNYELSKANIVEVNNNKVVAKKAGNVTLVATKYGQSASISLNIENKIIEPTSVALNNNKLSLYIGEVKKLEATVLPDTANNKTVTWASTNMNVATVSNGEVVGIKEGTSTITATTVNGKKASVVVEVKSKNKPTPTPTPTPVPTSTPVPTPTPTIVPTPTPTQSPRTINLIRGSIYKNGFLHYYEGSNGDGYEYNDKLRNNCGNRNSINSQYFTLYPANNTPVFQECHMEGDTKVYTADVNGTNDKLVKVTPNDEVQLDIVTYGKSYSPYGNTWPHLLITGRTGTNGLGVLDYFNARLNDGITGLTSADRSHFYFTNDNKINLSLDVKLNSYNKGNPINGVQAFQYLLFLEVYCDTACGNKQASYWFGFNLFDDRGVCYEPNQGDVRVDEKTKWLTVLLPSKGIYTNGTIYNGGNFVYNQWKHVDIDVSKRINELVDQIHRTGLTNVKASDLRYGGFNIGYEVHGEYWTSMSFKNLSLTSTKK